MPTPLEAGRTAGYLDDKSLISRLSHCLAVCAAWRACVKVERRNAEVIKGHGGGTQEEITERIEDSKSMLASQFRMSNGDIMSSW